MERKGDGSGLGCSELSFGSVFTGSSLKLSDGTRFTGSPSRTGSLKGMQQSLSLRAEFCGAYVNVFVSAVSEQI